MIAKVITKILKISNTRGFLLGSLFLFITPLSFSQVSFQEIIDYQGKVISEALQKIEEEFQLDKSQTGQARVENLLNEISRSPNKLKILKKFERKRERKFKIAQSLGSSVCLLAPFQFLKCLKIVNQVLNDLDIFCAQKVLPNPINGRAENFPCAAGGDLTNRNFDLETAKIFVEGLKNNSANTIDLAQEFEGQPKELLALLNFLYSSGSLELGFIDDFGYYDLKEGILNSETGEQIFDRFIQSKILKYRFQKVKKDLSVGEMSLKGKNRHDFMSAFLACHYGPKYGKRMAKLIPTIMGTLYESLDYISHRRKGISRKDSVRNFKKDTKRYRESAEWGYRFCNPN